MVEKSQVSYDLVVLTGHGKGRSKLYHIPVECPSPTPSSVMLNSREIRCVFHAEFQLILKVEGKSILRWISIERETRNLVHRQET